MRRVFFNLLTGLFFYINTAAAQQKEVTEQFQSWVGYMTSTRITEKFSWWNDFHYVPGGFFVARTGLTYHFPQRVNITGGYGFLELPTGSIGKELKRREHRPWGQLVVSNPISDNWSNTMRIRYDARFRKNIENGEIVDGYTFNHRLRMMASFRKQFPQLKPKDDWMPFLSLADEILINFGKNIVYNHLDQNRVTVTLGMQHKSLTMQVGYMNRFVQLASGNQFIMNHTAVLWMTHSFDRRRVIAPLP
ncbi:MAG: DUF2490 domain-containing protein [Cyclobacteriaceae bacterium]